MLHELIEFVHVDIHEKLRGEVPEREPLSWSCTAETIHDFLNERDDTLVLDAL